jgi:myo-inositol-1(or 4)-monophosphatase
MGISARLAAMIEAARAAGEGLCADFSRVDQLDVARKNGPADFVSAADRRSEETLRQRLSGAYPAYGFLGEETGFTAGEDATHTWVVDPLDGTTNFLYGIPAFAVNIALMRSGRVVAGVTYAPMLRELFHAEQGGGAFLNDRGIRVSPRERLENAVLGVGIPFMGKPRQPQFIAEMERLTPRVAGIRRIGAGAIDMAYVACGRYDAYWEQSVSAWDLAAGVILVEEAGGVVTDTRGGVLDVMNGTVLACTRPLQPVLLEALRPVEAR